VLVTDCRKAAGGRLFIHSCTVVGSTPLRVGDAVTAAVSAGARRRVKVGRCRFRLVATRIESARLQCLKLIYGKLLSTFAFNFNLRRYISANHSATHLLQSALKQVLGEEVRPAVIPSSPIPSTSVWSLRRI
jgi:hypothetical protein